MGSRNSARDSWIRIIRFVLARRVFMTGDRGDFVVYGAQRHAPLLGAQI